MRPCPTLIRARAVMVRTGSGPVDYIADRVQVIGVTLSSSGDEVDRSEVLDPLAPPRASVVLGRRMASVTIEQEVYGDLSQHAALFRACPVAVTQSSAGIAGSVSSSPSARGQRCTIEIVEVGGNRYRVEDALGVFALSGAPGERLLLTFDLQGELVPVEDAGLAPMAFIMPPAPLVYRNATLLASEQTFATCPEFSFDPGMTLGTTDYTCSPDGGRAAFVQRASQAVLALTGVLSGRESIDRHWAAARVPVCGATLDATVWSDGVSSSVRVELRGCATVDPALAEVEGFAAYDLAVGAASWSVVWDIDEGVPVPVQLGAVVWLDPTDASTLFVDAEGTTPCAPDDPVGLWKNKGTAGAVGDAKQAVSANRPLLGNGYVDFASTNNTLNTALASVNYPVEIVCVINSVGTGIGNRLVFGNRNYNQPVDGFFFGGRSLGGIVTQARTAGVIQNALYSIGSSKEWGIARSTITTTDVTQEAAGESPLTKTWSPELEPQAGTAAMRIGRGAAAGPMRIKELLVFDRVLTPTERAQVYAYLEARQ